MSDVTPHCDLMGHVMRGHYGHEQAGFERIKSVGDRKRKN